MVQYHRDLCGEPQTTALDAIERLQRWWGKEARRWAGLAFGWTPGDLWRQAGRIWRRWHGTAVGESRSLNLR